MRQTLFLCNICDVELHVLEWRVGYEEEGEGLLPSVTVSIGRNASRAEVLDGKIIIGRGDAVNLSDVRAVQKKAFQEENRGSSFLSVEPGRLMYHSLIVRSRSHKKSLISGPRIALLRMLCVHALRHVFNDLFC